MQTGEPNSLVEHHLAEGLCRGQKLEASRRALDSWVPNLTMALIQLVVLTDATAHRAEYCNYLRLSQQG
jgi:hypothetical protein